MPNTDHAERLRRYLEFSRNAEVPFVALAVQPLGDGITAVHDSLDEIDIYFDSEMWNPTMPEIWGKNCLYPAHARRFNLGVLPGVGRAPSVRNFDTALAFARDQLTPKNGATWFVPLPTVQGRP